MICQVIERLKKQNGSVIPFLSHMVWVVFPNMRTMDIIPSEKNAFSAV